VVRVLAIVFAHRVMEDREEAHDKWIGAQAFRAESDAVGPLPASND
jgi:hypothetical protein